MGFLLQMKLPAAAGQHETLQGSVRKQALLGLGEDLETLDLSRLGKGQFLTPDFSTINKESLSIRTAGGPVP